LKNLFGARPAEPAAAPVATVPIGDDFAMADGAITFRDLDRAGSDPRSWLRLFEAALDRKLPISNAALELVRAQATHLTAETMLWGAVECRRFVSLLRPRPGLSARLLQLRDAGVLAVLCPDFYRDGSDGHNFAAIGAVERLIDATDLSGVRFGGMLRELQASELVTVALLLHRPAAWRDHDPM
jgi:hypothetical protein